MMDPPLMMPEANDINVKTLPPLEVYHHHGNAYEREDPEPSPFYSDCIEGSNPRLPDFDMDGEQQYQCKLCGKGFSMVGRLQRHLRIHTGEKPFGCEFCEKSFSVKQNLNVHRRIHTKERPHQCNICNRAFEHSGKLHRHMRTHTGERPHGCELCGKTFVQSGQLVIHMRAHTGEKPYTCEYCHKGFTCSKQLKVHTRTHTGEKPYECDVCGKTFGYNHVLKMHKMSHLGKKLYKCTLCEQFFNSRKTLDTHIKDHDEDPFLPAVGCLTQPPDEECFKVNGPKGTNSGDSVPFVSSATPPLGPVLEPASSHCFREGERSSFRDAEGGFMEPRMRLEGVPPRCVVGAKTGGVGPASVYGSLTPPRSPGSPGSPTGGPSPNDPSKFSPQGLSAFDKRDFKSMEDQWKSYSGDNFPPGRSHFGGFGPAGVEEALPIPNNLVEPELRLAFFTTITGERIACPVNQVIRLSGPTAFSYDTSPPRSLEEEFQETLKMRQELKDKLRQEECRKQREKVFSESVMTVLESCIGSERLQKLGYPKYSIDEVIMNTLKLMGTQPCWEPSLASMDRIKVNLRLLLECCVPDQELWVKFGWRGKSIEDIVCEFLNNSN